MKRSRRSDSEIASIISASMRGGKNQQQFCAERGISYWTFRNWINRRNKFKAPPSPVISFSPQSQVPDERIEIRFPDTTTLRVPVTVPFKHIVAALRGKR